MQAAAAAGLAGAQERELFEEQLKEYEERRKVLIKREAGDGARVT